MTPNRKVYFKNMFYNNNKKDLVNLIKYSKIVWKIFNPT